MNKIFCRKKLRLHRNRAAFASESFDFLYKFSAAALIEKFEDLNFKPKNILEIGARKGQLSKNLKLIFENSNIITIEMADEAIKFNPGQNKLVCDEELLCFKENSFDLIISSLNLHWINDLPKFLFEIKNVLKKNGRFIANFIGGESLKDFRYNFIQAEIEANSLHFPHISPMIELHTITNLLQVTGFKNVITEREYVSAEYKNIISLMNDLRYMGEGASFEKSYNYVLNRKTLECLKKLYSQPFEENFEIISFTVEK